MSLSYHIFDISRVPSIIANAFYFQAYLASLTLASRSSNLPLSPYYTLTAVAATIGTMGLGWYLWLNKSDKVEPLVDFSSQTRELSVSFIYSLYDLFENLFFRMDPEYAAI